MSEERPKHEGERLAWRWWRTDALLRPDEAVEALGDMIEADVATLRAQLAKAQNALADIQRHRDHWRGYAYGLGDKPDDFLGGNLVDRPPTALETIEQIAQEQADILRSFNHTPDPGEADSCLIEYPCPVVIVLAKYDAYQQQKGKR